MELQQETMNDISLIFDITEMHCSLAVAAEDVGN